MSNSKKTKTVNGKVLQGYTFLMADGTYTTVYAETYFEAAKQAREEYYGR